MTETERREIIEKLAINLHRYFSEDAEWIWEAALNNANIIMSNNGTMSIKAEVRKKFEDLSEEAKRIYFERAKELFDIVFPETNKI